VQFADVLALVMLLVGVAAFVMGGLALSRASDLEAFYWLVVGLAGVRSSVQTMRPSKT
jgi:purine nucleoside permease